MANKCYKCSKELSDNFKIMTSRSDSCPFCMADIRCCRMCSFYDPKVYNECKETNADRITEKEKANFCDYFKFGPGSDDMDKIRQDALAKAASLFKK